MTKSRHKLRDEVLARDETVKVVDVASVDLDPNAAVVLAALSVEDDVFDCLRGLTALFVGFVPDGHLKQWFKKS